MRTTTTGTELARSTTLLLVKWAIIWKVSLFSNFQTNVSKFGVWSSLASSACLQSVCVFGKCIEKQGIMGWNEPLRLDTCAALLKRPSPACLWGFYQIFYLFFFFFNKKNIRCLTSEYSRGDRGRRHIMTFQPLTQTPSDWFKQNFDFLE